MKQRRVTLDKAGATVSDVTLILAGLGSDRDSIPANGTTFATLNYAGPEASPHAWTVNGVLSSEVALLDAASGLMVSELNVTAPQAGLIEVSVNGSAPLTLQGI